MTLEESLRQITFDFIAILSSSFILHDVIESVVTKSHLRADVLVFAAAIAICTKARRKSK